MLTERIESLEKRVAALESFQDPTLGHIEEQAAKRGRGKPLRLSDAELQGRRDHLIDWLEAVWPEIGPRLLAATNANKVREAVKAAPFESDQAKRLSAHADSLAEFLKSNRWFMPPNARLARAFQGWNTPANEAAAKKAAMSLPTRQIACAMAGLPELSWRTSFDRAQRLVSPMAVRAGTEEFYRIEFKLPWPKDVWERAKRGEPWAQYRLGLSYAHGIGVPEDYTLAAEWYERAAKLGEAEAQIKIAEMYRQGRGVEKSDRLALLWALVVPQTPERMRWQEQIAAALPPAQVVRLRRMAHELQSVVGNLRFERNIRPVSLPSSGAEIELLQCIDSLVDAAALPAHQLAAPTGHS